MSELEDAQSVKHRCSRCGIPKVALETPDMGVLLVCTNPNCDEDDRTPTIDISEGVIRTAAGTWTAKGLVEWAARLEHKLDEAIARWEASK